MVAIDMMQATLVVMNLFTLGQVGASTLAGVADAAAGGLQSDSELAAAGFATNENDETPNIGAAVNGMKTSEGRLNSVFGGLASLLGGQDYNPWHNSYVTDVLGFQDAVYAYFGAQ